MQGRRNGRAGWLAVAGMVVALAVTVGNPSSSWAGGHYTIDMKIDTVRGWTIGFNEVRRGCLARGSFRSGTIVEIGYDTVKDAGFLLFANDNWDLDKGGDYEVELTFDTGKQWGAHAEGVSLGKTMGLAFEDVKAGFILDFANYSSVRLKVGGEHLESVSLSGTRDAVKTLVDCSQYVSK